MVNSMTVLEFVDDLFVYHRKIVTPEQTLMFMELLTEYKYTRPMRSLALRFAVYDNNVLFYLINFIEDYFFDEVVPRVMLARNFFESIYSFWLDFEAKLGFIYQKLYEINNNIARERRNMRIGDDQRRTLTVELFVEKVLHNDDVNEKLKWKSEEKENRMKESEVRYFRLICQKLGRFRQEPRNGELLEFLEGNVPYLQRDV